MSNAFQSWYANAVALRKEKRARIGTWGRGGRRESKGFFGACSALNLLLMECRSAPPVDSMCTLHVDDKVRQVDGERSQVRLWSIR